MLKNAVVCLLIAATAAVAWQGLDPVPATAAVEDGAHITWGAGYVWGLFPTTSAGETYAGYYSPGSTDWTIVDQEVATEVLENTSITFQ